ncbi:MAG: methionyl-tRNA formyltransferase [Burkholderiaceae bacterium]|jgi:methionyl-tRNA formyltransferase|nr:methionyl-tRNA formyltransferase [Burkholderiaceae bacterium]
MRIAFAGTPDFARAALAALHGAGHGIVLTLTQPDRPAGRGLKLHPSPVKQWALDQGVTVLQPRSLRLDGRYPDEAAAARTALQAARPDALVVAAYGLILPRWALDLPRLGCLNIHASLLPRWRGAAPIQRAIEAGDAQTGVTIMQMDEGLDTGGMLLSEALPIGSHATAASLHDQLAALGARLIVQALGQTAHGPLRAVPQPAEGVTYAHKIDKAEAQIDWSRPAAEIERRIRAFDPFPGAVTRLGCETIKIWRAEMDDGAVQAPDARLGQILGVTDAGVAVACGQDESGGRLRLTELQRAGGKRLPAREFLRGFALTAGQMLDLPGRSQI